MSIVFGGALVGLVLIVLWVASRMRESAVRAVDVAHVAAGSDRAADWRRNAARAAELSADAYVTAYAAAGAALLAASAAAEVAYADNFAFVECVAAADRAAYATYADAADAAYAAYARTVDASPALVAGYAAVVAARSAAPGTLAAVLTTAYVRRDAAQLAALACADAAYLGIGYAAVSYSLALDARVVDLTDRAVLAVSGYRDYVDSLLAAYTTALGALAAAYAAAEAAASVAARVVSDAEVLLLITGGGDHGAVRRVR